eukprot:INCI7452.2.p1 GENE.INCI7452.2~~INCI7452.2.p1  ORF type:complete len:592 (+),score=114.26 INCI7452.2:139-1914(+)
MTASEVKASAQNKPSPGKRIRQVLAPERATLTAAALAYVVSSLGNFSLPAFVSFIIDRSTEAARKRGSTAAAGTDHAGRGRSLLHRFCGSMTDTQFLACCAAVFATSGLASFLRTYLLGLVTARTARRLRKEAFDVILSSEMDFFDTKEGQPAELLARLSGDIDALSSASSDIYSNFFRGMSSLVGGSVSMLVLSPRLTLATFALGTPLVVVAGTGFRLSGKQAKAAQEAVSATNQKALDMVSNISTVKLYTNEQHEKQKFCRAVDATASVASVAARAKGLMMGSMAFLGSATLLGVMFYGARQVNQGRLTVGDLTNFTIRGGMVIAGMGSLMSVKSTMRKTAAASESLFALLESKKAAVAETESKGALSGDIVFENVNFHYASRSDVAVLSNFNLTIEQGKTTVLVGPSGSGKSTAAALLTRLYEPRTGRITWGGRDVSTIPHSAIRRAIAVVEQNPVLFDGTLRENIMYGNLNAAPEDMLQAAVQANIDSFIKELPDGYDTLVGAGGARLSAGQRQRVVIARAILKNPALLILDEATSSLDRESEEAVDEAIRRLRVGRTVLSIAHRGLAIANADVVHEMAGGSAQGEN